jgi:Zn finger protein HypA/HybF involved in hydrogenase expression
VSKPTFIRSNARQICLCIKCGWPRCALKESTGKTQCPGCGSTLFKVFEGENLIDHVHGRQLFRCARCTNFWIGHEGNGPKRCPNCRSQYWRDFKLRNGYQTKRQEVEDAN